MDTRVCKACNTEKSIEEFRTSGKWRRHTCKGCEREKMNEYSRDRNKRDRDKVNARNAEWVAENREYDLQRKRDYGQEHRVEFNAWCCEQRRCNPNFRLKGVLRSRLRMALKGIGKSSSTFGLLGCNTDELKKHLEGQWVSNMTWGNYGGTEGWQIDHIRPCSSFDLTDPKQQRQCFHFSNLQPLWAEDNRQKSNKAA